MCRFRCRDKGVESFLHNSAFNFENRNFARTYLLLNEDEYIENNIDIFAYFTLSIKAMEFLPNVSRRKIQRIDGFSKNASSVGAVLIGQLGKDIRHKANISGEEIMSFALDYIYDVFNTAACRITFLECEPIEKLVHFYESCGFEPLQCAENDLLQMVRFL
jgi:hypothetical protein